ncbi:hypothetical protein GSI_03094 [Ganoderma sinense ZZ0214-1]|uniref:Uncharacterized protein n=1 Tax=Ganoderma sinense ZZ0214-1 TaxID=1077348 RepID=A0A2G8SKM9_9APHY|nr:hypothetical protein GSI_03094 [Ganoderma sinense ZZ0214-1]
MAAAAFTLSADDHDLLLHTGSNAYGGILSSRPARKKVKATEAEVVMVYSDCDPFGSSDLTELEDLDCPALPAATLTGKRRRRRNRVRKQESRDKQIEAGRVRLAHKAVATAQMKVNTVRLRNFEMEKAVHYTMLRDTSRVVVEEPIATELDGDTPQRVVSADRYDIVYRIPGACRDKVLDYVSDLCYKWGHLAKIKKSVANDKKGRYKRRQGGLVGTTRLCTLWHAVGHKCDDPTPSSDMLHSGETFHAAVDTICDLNMVSAYVMAALERIDPTQHSLLQNLWKKTCEKENVQKMFDSINGGLAYEGCEVVFNRVSERHWD